MKIKATQVDPETQAVQKVLLEDGTEASMEQAVQMFKEGQLDKIYGVRSGPFGEFLVTQTPGYTNLLDLPKFQ